MVDAAGERKVALDDSRLCVARWTATSDVEHAVCTLTAGPRRSSLCDTVVAKKSLSLRRVPEEEHADLLDELGVRQQVVEHVGVHAATGEHADRSGEALGPWPTSPAPPTRTRGSGGAAGP